MGCDGEVGREGLVDWGGLRYVVRTGATREPTPQRGLGRRAEKRQGACCCPIATRSRLNLPSPRRWAIKLATDAACTILKVRLASAVLLAVAPVGCCCVWVRAHCLDGCLAVVAACRSV
jgi:hypothetical protein